MTLVNSLPPSPDSDFNCVCEVARYSLHFRARSNSPVSPSCCAQNEIEAATGNGCVTIQRLGFERSKGNIRDEIALSLWQYPNETLYFDRADRAVPLLGIAQPCLRPVRIPSESKRPGR